MNKNIFWLIALAIAFAIGFHLGIGNQTMKYGKTGLAKNCRALISENLRGIASGTYSAEDGLDSIDRNCGASGLIWNER